MKDGTTKRPDAARTETLLDSLLPSAEEQTEAAIARAKESVKPTLPKRFYTAVTVGDVSDDDGRTLYRVLLDGRPIRTPAKNIIAVPGRDIADKLADEWSAQEKFIDAATMPLTRLVNSTIDGVEAAREAMLEEVVAYLNNDFLCYPASHPERLVERQKTHWQPILDWAERELGGRFVQASGILAVEQSPIMGQQLRGMWQELDIYQLAAVHSIMTLTGSALLSFCIWHGFYRPDQAWKAAMVDEDWNIEMWGADEEATRRRNFREMDFNAAVFLIDALRMQRA